MRSGLIPSWNRVPSSVGPRSEVGPERKTLWTEGFGRGVWCRDHWLKADPMRLCAPRRGIGKSASSSASVKPSMIVSTPSAVHVAGRSTRLGQERMAALTGVILAKGGCPITPKGGVLGPFRARLDRGWTLTPSRGEWRWSVPLPLRRVFFGASTFGLCRAFSRIPPPLPVAFEKMTPRNRNDRTNRFAVKANLQFSRPFDAQPRRESHRDSGQSSARFSTKFRDFRTFSVASLETENPQILELPRRSQGNHGRTMSESWQDINFRLDLS